MNDFFKKDDEKNEEITLTNSEGLQANEFKDRNNEVIKIKYCPYCGEELTIKEQKLICEHCDEEIGYVADSAEFNSDDFECLLIERKGRTYSMYRLILGTIATVAVLLCVTLSIIYSSMSEGSGDTIPYAAILGTTLISYAGIILGIIVFILSVIFERKCKKYGYKSIGMNVASYIVASIGVLYGLSFVIMVIIKAV